MLLWSQAPAIHFPRSLAAFRRLPHDWAPHDGRHAGVFCPIESTSPSAGRSRPSREPPNARVLGRAAGRSRGQQASIACGAPLLGTGRGRVNTAAGLARSIPAATEVPTDPARTADAQPPWRSLRLWAALSLAVLAANLALTWRWFDVDEFVNLQQAIRTAQDLPLYVATPSNHPPFYIATLLQLALLLPLDPLVTARVLSTLMTWGMGLLGADLWLRNGRLREARAFLVLWSLNSFAILLGTRAMNEVPLLFLLVLSVWLFERFHGAAGGFALAAGHLTRLTALFYAPAVIALTHSRRIAVAVTLIVGGLLFVAYSWGEPGFTRGFFKNVLWFHAVRDADPLWERIAEALWWSGAGIVALLAATHKELRDLRSRWVRAGAVAMAGSLAMIGLRAVQVHYFFPMALITTAGLAYALVGAQGRGDRRKARGWMAVALIIPLAQGVPYILTTPQHDLQDTDEVALWLSDQTPADRPILTDAPQFALRAERENYDGYYWSLRADVNDTWLDAALANVSVVLVSDRGQETYETAFSYATLQRLEEYPCHQLDGHRLYWTGVTGAPPAAFADDCGELPPPLLQAV